MNLQNIKDDRPIILDDNTTLRPRDLQLLFSCGMESAKVNEMITEAKRNYVKSKHSRAIFQLPPSKSWKNGCYKTYVYVDSKRKEITSSTEDKLIDGLVLESFDIVSLLAALEKEYAIKIKPRYVVPDNFNSVDAIVALVQKLMG